MTDQEQDQIDQAKIEAEQARADREGLLKEIDDLRNKVRVHQSAAGVQERHARDFREKLQKLRQEKEKMLPFMRGFRAIGEAKQFDAEAAQKLIGELITVLNGG